MTIQKSTTLSPLQCSSRGNGLPGQVRKGLPDTGMGFGSHGDLSFLHTRPHTLPQTVHFTLPTSPTRNSTRGHQTILKSTYYVPETALRSTAVIITDNTSHLRDICILGGEARQ